MNKQFGKVAVLNGGFSSEREVSLDSGAAVLAALQSRGIDAHRFDPKEQDILQLKAQGFQVAFNVLHGTYGEDGTVQALLDSIGIPYTGCGMAASALGMDKYRCKLIWQALGLPVPDFAVLHDDTDFAAVEAELGLPMFVKPAAEGSSVGVVKVKQPGELPKVYRELRERHLHGEIIAERFIDGGEYTCAVLGRQALPSIRIIPATEFYDYDAKYGWGRVDFLRSQSGKLYLLEINTVPGMTSHSLVPKAAAQTGLDFADLCVEVLSHATLG